MEMKTYTVVHVQKTGGEEGGHIIHVERSNSMETH